MEGLPLDTLGYAFLGGILPAMLWLYFLLKEDSRCPEPRAMIVIALIAGMIAVPASLPFETFFAQVLAPGLPMIVAWAAIEETMKYALASLLVLWRRSVNESVDMVIYMVTVALGFAALENALFLVGPFLEGRILDGLFTNNLRFVGATLLHVIASAMIGFALAFAYLRTRPVRLVFAVGGLILAIALHALFNFLIIAPGGSQTLTAFFLVWSGAIVFFALFEILKYFRYRHLLKNTC